MSMCHNSQCYAFNIDLHSCNDLLISELPTTLNYGVATNTTLSICVFQIVNFEARFRFTQFSNWQSKLKKLFKLFKQGENTAADKITWNFFNLHSAQVLIALEIGSCRGKKVPYSFYTIQKSIPGAGTSPKVLWPIQQLNLLYRLYLMTQCGE